MLKLFKKSESGLFASQTIAGHLIRGIIAFALLCAAVDQQHAHPVLAVLGGLAALFAMRGCPMCWAIGLFETLKQKA